MSADTIREFSLTPEPISQDDLETITTIRNFLINISEETVENLEYSDQVRDQYQALIDIIKDTDPKSLILSHQQTKDVFTVPENNVHQDQNDQTTKRRIALIHYKDTDVWKISHSVIPQNKLIKSPEDVLKNVKTDSRRLGNVSLMYQPERIALTNFWFVPKELDTSLPFLSSVNDIAKQFLSRDGQKFIFETQAMADFLKTQSDPNVYKSPFYQAIKALDRTDNKTFELIILGNIKIKGVDLQVVTGKES